MKTAFVFLLLLSTVTLVATADALPIGTGHESAPAVREFEFTAIFDCVQLSGGDCQSELYGVTTQTEYSGQFGLRESALDTDGTVFTEPYFFYFQIGATTFDSTRPCGDASHPSDFCNFIGYQDPSPFDGRWTVSIESGRVLGLCCGLYGPGDVTFVEMSTNPPNPHSANPGRPDRFFGVSFYRDQPTAEGQNGPLIYAQGTFTWRERLVPEPSSLLMLLAGVLALGCRMAGQRRTRATL